MIIKIPARRGKAHRVKKGQSVKVINTHGTQVVDTWAFNADDVSEFMSMSATRTTNSKISPKQGDTLYSNNRRAIFSFLEDTSPGVHDTLVAACDRYRYELLGCEDYHDNCTDNLKAALAELGLDAGRTPDPLNMFMNIPWTQDGQMSFEPQTGTPGDYVLLRAEMDLIVAFSTCPQDMLPINGKDAKPVEAHFEII